jgi:TonB family protein
MTRTLAVFLLLLGATGVSDALTTGGSVEFLNQRIAELDASLLRLKLDVVEGRVTEAQKADVATLQKSLEAERALLLERKAVLLRLEPAAAAAAPAPAPTPGPAPGTAPAPATAPTPAGPTAAASTVPLSSPKPKIPDEICQQRLSGFVGLEFAVLPDGKVADVKVTASEPKGAFDSAAVEAVAGRTYAARPLPMKMKEKMFMSYSDCRAEQLRVSAPTSPEACATLAVESRAVAAPFTPEESGRAVLAGGAQTYSAPSPQCEVAGKMLRAGMRLTARMEYRDYSLVTDTKGANEVWVRSNQLKDTAP